MKTRMTLDSIFEIDFVGQMFDDYKPIKLDIWRTFTDTIIGKII